ncbi:MAG: hypothetical protein OSB70_12150 [Myxococcota bacterium]|nr:hypothetical protein [Myxococcota bacterium]
MIRPRTAWLALLIAWLAFFGWYTSFKGPLTTEEIDTVLRIAEASDADPEDIAKIRHFLESDTGDDFVMVNLIEINDPPPRMEGVPEDATAQDLMGRYMKHMYPELLKRASHPVLFGQATAPALDIWGIEGASQWTTAGLMRYRSRRDMLEIAGNPDFRGPHEFKIAAMNKTIAFPADPWFQAGDLRLLLALFLIILGLTNSLRWAKRPAN